MVAPYDFEVSGNLGMGTFHVLKDNPNDHN